MTEEQYLELKRQVEELLEWKSEKEKQQLRYPVDPASKEALGIRDLAKVGDTGSADTQAINLTGNAQTINVPEQPAGTIEIEDNDGNTYKVFYQTP